MKPVTHRDCGGEIITNRQPDPGFRTGDVSGLVLVCSKCKKTVETEDLEPRGAVCVVTDNS
jgi:hypothetical protein